MMGPLPLNSMWTNVSLESMSNRRKLMKPQPFVDRLRPAQHGGRQRAGQRFDEFGGVVEGANTARGEPV